MSFHDSAVFPENVSYGSSGGPGHSTTITVGDGGAEVRTQRWAGARCQFEIVENSKKPDDTASILSFYRAMEGAAHGFRIKDHSDWSTGRNHTYPPSTNVLDRVQLQDGGDGVSTVFQLTKPYTAGNVTKWRTITRPMSTGYQTVTRDGFAAITNYVWTGDDLLAEGTDWTLNASTGEITFAVAPGNGVPIYASFAFHVPVRFDESTDDLLEGSIDAGNLVSFGSLRAVELVDALEGSECWDPGGASIVAMSAAYQDSIANGVFHILQPDGPGIILTLPDFNALPLGYPLELLNDSAHDLDVRLHTAAAFFTLAAGEKIRMKVGGNNGVPTGWFSI